MNENIWPLILLGGGLLAFLLVVSFLSKNYSLNNFKSKTVGDGQHGTARWATPREISKTYRTVPFRPRRWRKGEDLPTEQGLVLGSVGGRNHKSERGFLLKTSRKLLEKLRRPVEGKRKTKKKSKALSKVKKMIEEQRDIRALVDSDDVHCLMIGASGVGKTAFFLYPNLEYACACGMSYLALDTKGDLARNYGCIASKYYGYYIGIVGKFGAQVQTVLKKAAALDIQTICPLHGPVLTENLGYYINLYNIWSSYAVESEGVMIAYSSVYGNTKKAVEYLAEELKAKGCPKVVVCDLAREDMAEAVEDAFRYGKLVLATTTYNGDIFPFMRTFIDHLTERNFQNRKIALVENGSWAPVAAKVMAKALEGSKNIELAGTVTIRGALKEENKRQLAELAAGLMQ